MEYLRFVELYDRLAATSKKFEKIILISDFLKELRKEVNSKWIYLLRGRVVPDYDSRELGISTQLIMKTLSEVFGISQSTVITDFNKKGDLSALAENYADRPRQRA